MYVADMPRTSAFQLCLPLKNKTKKTSFKVQYITLEKIDHSTYYSFRKKNREHTCYFMLHNILTAKHYSVKVSLCNSRT